MQQKSIKLDTIGWARIVQETEFWPYKQMVYAQPHICPKEWHTLTPLGFWLTNGSQTTRSYNNQKQKKITCKIVDFVVPADHRVKLKESEKKDKYLDLTTELKNTGEHESDIYTNCNWCSLLGTVTKGLIKGLKDLKMGKRGETIQTTALLRSARILVRILETWGGLLSLKL